MESDGDLWLEAHTLPCSPFTQPAPSVMENQGSGDFSSQDGSQPSSSSTSSERNHSAGLVDDADDFSALLKDDEVRALLKKVTVNEGVLNKAIQSLGGGEIGLKSLMGYILLWVKQQRENKSSSQQQPQPPSNSASLFSTAWDVGLQPNSDATQILGGIPQSPSAAQATDQDIHPFQRFKSRRLMMCEPEMDAGLGGLDTGFCPSNFISTPEECKPETTSPGILASCIPQLSCGVLPQQPVIPFTTAHITMPSVHPTPAMTTKAARRHRMARQRQSTHARAASHAATAPVSPAVGSTRSKAAALPFVKSPGMPVAQTATQISPVTVARKSRNTDALTLLFQKELRPSDIGNLGRVIIPKKEAEQHMPFLAVRGSVIQMEDFDSGHTWNLRYSVTPPPKVGSSPLVTSGSSSFWPNNKSRMYLLENTGEFVKSHGLVEGDLLIIYRNLQGGYVLRGKKKKSRRLDVEPVRMTLAHSSAKGFVEGPTPANENGMLVQRLYGGGPSDKGLKEEPMTLDDDPFLKDMVLSVDPSFEPGSICLETLERFPSLNLDFPLEEIMAATKTEPEG